VKLTWYSNACVTIRSSAGASILCDPWVNPGAALGSWFQWPPVPSDFESHLLDLKIDGVFISHLHPDHYDPKFIAKYSRAKPDIPIYIPEFSHPWLKRSLEMIVANPSKVIQLPTLKEVEVGDGMTLTALAADTCNPLICGANIPCQTTGPTRGIDGIGVFRADGLVLVNANDAMAIDLVPRIAANLGKTDILLGHYGAASPYPQCFPAISDKQSAIIEVVDRTCNMLLQAADALDVEHIMPFAGQYVLGGRLHEMNANIGTLPLDKIVKKLRAKTERHVVSVEPFGEIDFSSGVQDSEYVEPSQVVREEYLKEISKHKFIYEDKFASEWLNFEGDLIAAAEGVLSRSKFSKISAENSFVIGDGVHFVTIDLYPDFRRNQASIGSNPSNATITFITMPEDLLRLLCSRKRDYKGFTPLHWNQADGGSHFIWERNGTFDLDSHMLLNFFGC
jgi:UDP-MurNAc hydroxylase